MECWAEAAGLAEAKAQPRKAKVVLQALEAESRQRCAVTASSTGAMELYPFSSSSLRSFFCATLRTIALDPASLSFSPPESGEIYQCPFFNKAAETTAQASPIFAWKVTSPVFECLKPLAAPEPRGGGNSTQALKGSPRAHPGIKIPIVPSPKTLHWLLRNWWYCLTINEECFIYYLSFNYRDRGLKLHSCPFNVIG
ncbi:hypothetical protein F2P79_011345 [Pimephales promelas]|nr:hypothetical protein F2P79_011345 [Pimephales promelas]